MEAGTQQEEMCNMGRKRQHHRLLVIISIIIPIPIPPLSSEHQDKWDLDTNTRCTRQVKERLVCLKGGGGGGGFQSERRQQFNCTEYYINQVAKE